MESDQSPIDKKSPAFPLYEQRGSIVFMLFLLVVSGITATVVGYRVKSADINRKNELMKTYQLLGGSFADSVKLDTSLALSERFNDKQKVFITAYETNVRTKLHGFPNVLEAIDTKFAPVAIRTLFEIKATEAAKSFRDSWEAYVPDLVATSTNVQVQDSDSGSNEDEFAVEKTSRATSDNDLASAANRPPLNPTALRYARQYDRYIIRDTELKLFQYLNENRSAIVQQAD